MRNAARGRGAVRARVKARPVGRAPRQPALRGTESLL